MNGDPKVTDAANFHCFLVRFSVLGKPQKASQLTGG
jgi:hypothetical protein